MKFTGRPAVRLVKERLQAALQEVAEELGISVEISGGRYNEDECTFKLECASVSDDGTVHNADEESFKRNSALYGLKPEAFGTEFVLRGKAYIITGLHPRRHKYPISADRVGDGKRFKFPSYEVIQGLVDKTLVYKAHKPW